MLPPVKREFAIMFTLRVAVELKKDPESPNIPNCGRISFSVFKKMETAAGFRPD
jgi:hypothetical protein